MSFLQRIHDNLAQHPDKPAITEVHGDQLLPFGGASVLERAARARACFVAHQLSPGDRVVLVASNSADWVAADLAMLWHGLIAVPLYARQDPAELVGMMRDCGPALVIAADDTLAATLAQAGAPEPLITLDQLFAPEPAELPLAARDSHDVITLVYTSGTSGEPKGVMLTLANVDHMLPVTAGGLARMMGSTEGEDRVFHYLPFCFGGSRVVLWTCLFRNNNLMASTDLDQLVAEMGAARPNYFLNVPVLLERIKNGVEAKIRQRAAPIQWLYDRGRDGFIAITEGRAGKRDRLWSALASRLVFAPIKDKIGPELRCLICGSAPLGADTQRWFEMLGIPVYQVYGLTETTAIVTMDRPPQPIKPGRVGPAIDGCELKLSDEGELWVKGPNIFKGYWGRSAATAAAFEGEWFRSGDLAEVDDDGNWRIIGRSKNLLVPTSGHNVAPEPIEQQLVETIEGVQDAVLIGHGRPWLAAILTGELSPEAIQDGLDRINEELPHYRRIRRFHHDPEPFSPERGLLTATNKLRRAAIEAHYAGVLDQMYGEASADQRAQA